MESAADMPLALPVDPDSVKGFLDPHEGQALHDAALAAASRGPLLEIGSYCGKSALYLGTAARAGGAILYSLDHHRGSEEHQPGWDYFDADLWDATIEAVDTLPAFRRTLHRADLEAHVVPLVGQSPVIARHWATPLGFLFIDGGHSMAAALADYDGWTPHLVAGGTLAIHDVFPDPADGGRPPYEIYCKALESGDYAELGAVASLRLLRRR